VSSPGANRAPRRTSTYAVDPATPTLAQTTTAPAPDAAQRLYRDRQRSALGNHAMERFARRLQRQENAPGTEAPALRLQTDRLPVVNEDNGEAPARPPDPARSGPATAPAADPPAFERAETQAQAATTKPEDDQAAADAAQTGLPPPAGEAAVDATAEAAGESAPVAGGPAVADASAAEAGLSTDPGLEPAGETAGATLEPGPDIRAWRTRMVGAAQSIPVPRLPHAESAASAVHEKGGMLVGGRAGPRNAIRSDAEAAAPKPPEPEKPLPAPPPEPVPGATTLVEETAGRRLSPATLPDLQPSPRGTQPTIADPAAQPKADEAERQAPSEKSDAGRTSSESAPEDEAVCRSVEEAAGTSIADLTPGSAEGATIEDIPPPTPPPLPLPVTNIMREVIARLLANPREQAEPIITGARQKAYPNAVLETVYPQIGSDRLDGISQALTDQLRLIAEQAGVAGADLDAALARRQEEVARQAADAQGAATEAGNAEKDKVSAESDVEVGEVQAAAQGIKEHADAVTAAAAGEGSPALINAQRDSQIAKINQRAGAIRVEYEQAKGRRTQALDRAQRLQEMAYDRVSQDDQSAMDASATDRETFLGAMQKGAIRNWAADRKRDLARSVIVLKANATAEADGYRDATRTAAEVAAEQIRDWAAERTGETMSWWDRLWARFTDWSQQAKSEADSWAVVRAGEARDATINDLGTLVAFTRSQGEAVDLDKNDAFQHLSGEQQEVIRTYYAAPPGSRDTLGAVAAGLRFRLAAEQTATLVEAMQAEVIAKPNGEADNLEQIGQAENGSFSASSIADKLYEAMFGGVTGWGTDEEKIYGSLSGLTKTQGRAVRATYAQDHGSDLDADLESELDENSELVRAKAQLDGDVVLEAVGALNVAMDGVGTDEDTIMKVLRGKTAEQRAAITAEYKRRYGVDLEADLKSELSDHDLERAEALVEGDTARADAVVLDDAMHGGLFGWGTDEGKIEGVYSDIRNDVAAEQVPDGKGGMRPMTQAEMEAEVGRRNSNVEASYDARYGSAEDQESALRVAYNDELSGPDLDLANALADNDLVAADTARLERERQSIVYADDDAINAVLASQYERALDAQRRDPAMKERRDKLQERARKEGWDPYALAAAERALDREMEQSARAGANENMAALEKRYGEKYPQWGANGLDSLIENNMSGTDRDKASKLVEQGGYLSRAQQIDYATRGLGTDEAAFEKATTGLTAAEIDDVNNELAGMGRPSVQTLAEEELDGRELANMRVTLKGAPENADQEMDRAQERTDWELRNSPVGGHQRDVLEKRLARMRHQYDLVNDPKTSPADRKRAMAQFGSRATGVRSGIESYRNQVDAVTDAVATAASLTAAIVVTVVTGGIAGAVLGALYAAVTSMLVKTVMKGAAYGTEEMAIDAVVGIVDAAAAAATFGVGNALLRVAEEGGGRFARLSGAKIAGALAKMAESSSRAQRMLAHGVSQAVEGAAGALPSALAGNMLNDKNWEHGNPLANIVGGTLTETGMGAVMGGGLGSLGGYKLPEAKVPHLEAPAPRTGDILAQRGTPADRLKAWKEYKAINPDAEMGGFLHQYDRQIAERIAKETADAGIQRQLRGELLAGIPQSERRAFADAHVEIMSDADFKAFTRSDSANAVTLVENGRARVIFRDGAPLSVLREEGIHLHQIADPDLGRIARRLDEAKLRDWDRLPLAEKLELYAAKLDLEIDAQNKLIAGLENEMRHAGPDLDIDGFARQIDAARDSLSTLSRRADEVGGFGILDRVAMATGLREPPAYLDQPARLFNKINDKPPKIRNDPKAQRTELPKKGERSSALVRKKGFVQGDKIFQVGNRWIEPRVFQFGELADDIVVMHGKKKLFVSGGALVDAKGRIVTLPKGTAVTVEGRAARISSGGSVEVDQVYREVQWTDARGPKKGQTKGIRQEAMAISKETFGDLSWVQRGSDSVTKGGAAELGSRRMSEQRIIKGKTKGASEPRAIAQLDVQNPSGSGFDGAEVHVNAEGKGVLKLVEVKNYPDRWVPYEDFTAITENFGQNLADLDAYFEVGFGAKALEKKAAELEMDVETLRLIREALDDGRVELEIRHPAGTRIGVQGPEAAYTRLAEKWKELSKELDLVPSPLPPPRNLPDQMMREAEAALAAAKESVRNKARVDILTPPFTALSSGEGFVDAADRALLVQKVTPGEIAGDAFDRTVERLAAMIRKNVTLPDGGTVKPMLALDVGDLSPSAQKRLAAAIRKNLRANKKSGEAAARRLIPLHTR
jgi:hypothetical protein